MYDFDRDEPMIKKVLFKKLYLTLKKMNNDNTAEEDINKLADKYRSYLEIVEEANLKDEYDEYKKAMMYLDFVIQGGI